MKRTIQGSVAAGSVALILSIVVHAQAHKEKPSLDPLQWLSTSLEQVATRISPSVVSIEVAGYGAVGDAGTEDDNDAKVQRLTKERSTGSGVIVDPDGYIVTALHVIKGARRIRVELDRRVHPTTSADQTDASKTKFSFEATIVGTFEEADLAILKIESRGLPAISFADSDNLKQGQLVAALGSPEGLRNSFSLGVVSSAHQQIGPDDSMAYIQTDTAMAPGSSGSPLINIQGGMVGINAFTITDRGREYGLGFAVPSTVVRFAYEQIRQNGLVPRAYLGVYIQGVTPTLASALLLPTNSGIIVAGGASDAPAGNATLVAGDVLASFDGKQLHSVPELTWALLHKHPGDHASLEIWRNSRKMVLDFRLVGAPPHPESALSTTNIEEGLVVKLGIVGSTQKHEPRGTVVRPAPPGVLVVARLGGTDSEPELSTGDVIRSVNNVPMNSVAQLRAMIDGFKSGDAIALQVERDGKPMYLSFEMD